MEIDIAAQKKYWQDGAVSDLETADILLRKGKYLEGLFFCHLAIEKAIKSRVVEVTKMIPPKTHNLLRLAELGNVSLDVHKAEFFGEMMAFHIEGRYPDSYPNPPEPSTCMRYLAESIEVVKWLAG